MRFWVAGALLMTGIANAQITGTVEYYRQVAGDGLKPRDVIVWLPPSYAAETNRAYPVLYMHDGQNIVDPRTSFLGIDWGVDETATYLIKEKKLEEIIVVGMYNTIDRAQEYGEEPVKTEAYVNFVVGQMKPFIDEHYRTKPEREHTAVMGSSMGGLISFILAWEHPEIFSAAACLSPAFMFTNWLNRVASYDGPPKDIRIYMDNGGVGIDEKLQAGCDQMLELLPKKGITPVWYKDEKAEHNEVAWSKRVWRPLEFMFGIGAGSTNQAPE